MPLNMTKIAFRAESIEELRGWVEGGPEAIMTTRYLPKRHEEMIGGSLFWIFDHTLVARSPIIAFEKREDGRWSIRLEPRLIPVHPRPKRAHQGWRYLSEDDAPQDLGADEDAGDVLPGKLLNQLNRLGLV